MCTNEGDGMAVVFDNFCTPPACDPGETPRGNPRCAWTFRYDACNGGGCWRYVATCERWCSG